MSYCNIPGIFRAQLSRKSALSLYPLTVFRILYKRWAAAVEKPIHEAASRRGNVTGAATASREHREREAEGAGGAAGRLDAHVKQLAMRCAVAQWCPAAAWVQVQAAVQRLQIGLPVACCLLPVTRQPSCVGSDAKCAARRIPTRERAEENAAHGFFAHYFSLCLQGSRKLSCALARVPHTHTHSIYKITSLVGLESQSDLWLTRELSAPFSFLKC